ncbi:MAG TPA: TetR/AcrR family transcriptional regulator [Acidimicrobiales bacterium]|nr:TetR/AcrR family transcriptional regulator [Acidimicrobiales bacterium]
MAEAESVIALLERLPPRPGPSMARLLDATERCLARYGIRRTSMSDIAREMHVARTTLYRQVSSVEEAVALVASRQLHRFLDDLLSLLSSPGGVGPAAFIEAIAGAVRFARSDPVCRRVLEDEPDLLGSLVAHDLRPHATQVANALTPIVAAAMEAGAIRSGDPRLSAQWMVRVVAALVALPPEGDLEDMLHYALEPVLSIPGVLASS